MPHMLLGIPSEGRSRFFLERENAFITASMIVESERREKEKRDRKKPRKRRKRR